VNKLFAFHSCESQVSSFKAPGFKGRVLCDGLKKGSLPAVFLKNRIDRATAAN
jgi:hypothetical protein